MDSLIFRHFRGLLDEKLKQVLNVAEIQGASADGLGNHYDYMRLLDIYKSRHAGP